MNQTRSSSNFQAHPLGFGVDLEWTKWIMEGKTRVFPIRKLPPLSSSTPTCSRDQSLAARSAIHIPTMTGKAPPHRTVSSHLRISQHATPNLRTISPLAYFVPT